MKPSDSNLSTTEFIKYFVTDEDTIRHFNKCLSEIERLEGEVLEQENKYDDYWTLQDTIADLEYDLERKDIQIASLENRIRELEHEWPS